jgi:hypothetical protein
MDNTIDWFSNFVEAIDRYPTREELNDLNIVPTVQLVEYALIYNSHNLIEFIIKEYPEIVERLSFRTYIFALSLGRITNLTSIITSNIVHFNTIMFNIDNHTRTQFLNQYKESLIVFPEGISFPDYSHEDILRRNINSQIYLDPHDEWLLMFIYNNGDMDYIINLFPKLPHKYKTIFKVFLHIDYPELDNKLINEYIPTKKYIDIYCLILSYYPHKLRGIYLPESFMRYMEGGKVKSDHSLYLLQGNFTPDHRNYEIYGNIVACLIRRLNIDGVLYLMNLFDDMDILDVTNKAGMLKRMSIYETETIYKLVSNRVSIEEIYYYIPSMSEEFIRLLPTSIEIDPIKYIDLITKWWNNGHYSLYSFNQLFLYRNTFVGLTGEKYDSKLLTDIFNNIYDNDRLRI